MDGLTADENFKVVHTLVMCDRRRDLQSIASEVGIRIGAILTRILGMSKVSAGWVLGMLTNDQKKTWLHDSRYLPSRYEDDPGDFPEMRYGFITLTRSQTRRANNGSTLAQPHHEKATRDHSAGKVMTSIFLDSQWFITIDYLEQGRTMNGAYFAGKLKWLRQEIARERRGKLTCGVLHKLS